MNLICLRKRGQVLVILLELTLELIAQGGARIDGLPTLLATEPTCELTHRQDARGVTVDGAD
jgi:hypothetical protein